MIKRAWAAQLEVLNEIDIICKRHSITYFAEWGTLLGAIRHKGFIPWDDDLDIGMRREDYDRFLYYAPLELPEGMELINPFTEAEYGEVMSRVITGRAICVEEEYLEKYHGCPYVMGIDIFPQDYIPRDGQSEYIQLELLKAANLLAQSWQSEEISEEEKKACMEQLAELSGVHIREDVPVYQQLYQLSDRICAMYTKEEADEISQLCLLVTNSEYRLPAECYEKTIEMPFENITIPVPVGYEQILKLRYGENYMTPVKNWGTHDYPFFKSQEEVLRQAYENINREMPSCFAE